MADRHYGSRPRPASPLAFWLVGAVLVTHLMLATLRRPR